MSPRLGRSIATALTQILIILILLSRSSGFAFAADAPLSKPGAPSIALPNLAAAAAPGSATARSPLVSPTTASAAILGLDTKTQGAWVGHYGSDGYELPNQATRLPGYAKLTVSTPPDTAISSTSDPKVLKILGRSAGPWTNWGTLTSFSIDLSPTDRLPHKVSFYALDYYNAGWRQRITIKDASTGALLSTQNLSSYNGGVYISWQVSGHVIFDITSTADQGCCGVVSGVFFDPPEPLTRPTHLIVLAKTAATAIGITAPNEPNYPPASLSIKVSALPRGGTVTLVDGLTPVTVGQRLSPAQLTGLKFVPGPVAATRASNFAYTVTDPAGRSAAGSAVIVVELTGALPPAPTCLSSGMESVPVAGNDRGEPVSLLVPRSGIQPSEIAVVINDSDLQSVIVGQYYQLKRGIPNQNMVHVDFPFVGSEGANYTISAKDFSALKSKADAQLGPNIQAYAITWTQPWSVGGGVGLTTAFSMGYGAAAAANPYYNSGSVQPYTDLKFRPSMMVASLALQDALSLIDRGTLAAQTLPSGNGYFVRTTDAVRSNPRYEDFEGTFVYWDRPNGLHMTYIDNSAGTGSDFIQNAANILFYETSLSGVPAIGTNKYLPGAVADHLTSFGGALLEKVQMSVLDWLQAGVTASYGTITEPGADYRQFPQASILVNTYFSGNTVVEAYTKSVELPTRGAFVGDPLARPFGTKALLTNNGLSIKTSILKPRFKYALLGGASCSGPFSTLQSNISISQQAYKSITDTSGYHAFYRLVATGSETPLVHR